MHHTATTARDSNKNRHLSSGRAGWEEGSEEGDEEEDEVGAVGG